MKRVGLLAKKISMTRIFDDFGDHHPVTVLECPEALVTGVAQNSKQNVQLASFEIKERSINKPQLAEYKKLKSATKKYRSEYSVDDTSAFEAGQIVTVEHFITGQLVDVRGRNSGKGFAGSMKRHNFSGLEASHGVSVSHRAHGSTGQCQDPGRVFKGKKMAGQMGNKNITVQNLEVMRVDSENNLIFIRGAVPGKKGTVVTITDAIKKSLPSKAPYPAFFKKVNKKESEAKSEIKEEIAVKEATVTTKKEVK